MGEKCIVYTDERHSVYAQKYSGQSTNLFSMKDFRGRAGSSANISDIGFSPGNLFGISLMKNEKYNENNGKWIIDNSLLVHDLLANDSIDTFYLGRTDDHYSREDIFQTRIKSGRTPELIATTEESGRIHRLVNVVHQGYLRPVTTNNNSMVPYQISPTEILIPTTGKILHSQLPIISPHIMDIRELERSMRKKNPQKFERAKSFFRSH